MYCKRIQPRYNSNMVAKRQHPPRPGGPSTLKRTTALMIRVTDEQRRAFEQAAAMSGLSTSSWARMKLLETIRKEDEK
jgi:hypothetical protein